MYFCSVLLSVVRHFKSIEWEIQKILHSKHICWDGLWCTSLVLPFQQRPRFCKLCGRNDFVGLLGHFLCIKICQLYVQPGLLHLTETKLRFSPSDSAVKFLMILRYGKSGSRTWAFLAVLLKPIHIDILSSVAYWYFITDQFSMCSLKRKYGSKRDQGSCKLMLMKTQEDRGYSNKSFPSLPKCAPTEKWPDPPSCNLTNAGFLSDYKLHKNPQV